ncbi:MAG: tetratricopeptide repeat protein [Nitrospirota bacterium]
MGKKQGQTRVQSRAGMQPPPKQAAQSISTAALIGMSLLLLYAGYLTVSAYQRNGIFKTTVTLWKSAVESAPDKRRTHENYGQALSTAGLLDEALVQFKTVLALPDDGSVPLRDVHREIGVVYFRLGRIDESIDAWKKGLEHAYMDAGLLNNIAIALMKQQRFEEALAHAEMAVKANPYMPEPANTAGEVYMAKGDYKKAAQYFMIFLRLRPEDSRAYWNAALAFERTGEYETALRFANQFLAMESNPAYRQGAMQMVSVLNARLSGGKK